MDVQDEIKYLEKYLPADQLATGLKRLAQGEAVQYIVGNVDFYGHLFQVNPNVLIPRFETEELVYQTIQRIQKMHVEPIKILDIGTGSGCIAITLKKEIPTALVTAVDISEDALKVAEQNAQDNEVEINFIKSDMLKKVTGTYHVIISNPPYIALEDEVDEVVIHNEPFLALYAPNHGLKYYEEILQEAYGYLEENAMIAFEIGENQGSAICKLAHHYFPTAQCQLKKDMQGKDRFIFITLEEK